MKLVVVDVSSVNEVEREFVSPIVKVGRDSEQCQIVFDRVTWPMVSRHHSEFRSEAGKYVLLDSNSTFGTFVNGQRVKGTVEVQTGALIQFGVGGPRLRVGSIDSTVPPRPEGHLNPTSQPRAWLEIAGQESNVNGRVSLSSEITLLGRDQSSAISFNSYSVSRRHAEIRWRNEQFVLIDLNSYNGTFVNGERVYDPALLYNNDVIQLGIDTPALRFIDPQNSDRPHKRAVTQVFSGGHHVGAASETLVVRADSGPGSQPLARLNTSNVKPFIEWTFRDKPYISLGRDQESDIQLDSLQVSVHHARFIKDQDAILIEDKGSTNGVYINGKRIDHGRKKLEQNDIVQIGPFVLQAGANTIRVFDTRAKTRIDVLNVNKFVRQGNREAVKLLDAIDLTIQPNEFIGLLGSSGAGKSTLMNALNGMSAPSSGQVLINDLDLYGHLASLKHSIGYVPQDDIIHRELTVERTLSYVAGLRLSRDVSKQEVDEIIDEVLDVTGLTERRDVLVASLSGGQRKRVSIAVELITKPSIIFLDEPTSGLDPATEERIMKLFRQITESGRTVVLTTHNTANIHLFDKVVVLMQGSVIFYGEPAEALAHFQVNSFNDLYDLLVKPAGSNENWGENSDAPAEKWRRRFQSSELYQRNIAKPLKEAHPSQKGEATTHPRLRFSDALRQWKTLVKRYLEILTRDRMALLVLLGQSPLIGVLTYLVINAEAPRDFPYFMLALVASWFGTSIAAREIVRERPIYKRERMFNLGLLPYVSSKLFVLTLVVAVQCTLLFAILKILHFSHFTYLPGRYLGLPQLLVMILTGVVGIALGLVVSALVKTSEVATSLVPLILIPQILFSGINGVPKGTARLTGAAMPVTWSFDEMKRLSGLQPLNEDGSVAKYFNQKVLEKLPKFDEKAVSSDLKEFVSFTHPWGGIRANSVVLLLMLFLFVVGTIAILRAQDHR